MTLDSLDWSELLGGARQPYDPRPALEALQQGKIDVAAEELWENLLHQGDVDTAGYASVPMLARIIKESTVVDWNAYGLMASIEEGRLSGRNPSVPSSLRDQYFEAWAAVIKPALRDLASVEDENSVVCILAVLAHAKGQHSIGIFALCTEDERQEMLAR
jgi:hypothetical protein